jgi:hypothetical protein
VSDVYILDPLIMILGSILWAILGSIMLLAIYRRSQVEESKNLLCCLLVGVSK